MTCDTCKHSTKSGEGDSLLTCDQPKHLRGYNHGYDAVPVDGILLENDEGWAWIVGPKFGCINWEVE